MGISEGDSLLDVASGTGVLYQSLNYLKLSKYVALDISENMLSELKVLYPKAETVCDDFDKEITLENKFDFVVIFNSIPHFENLNTVFKNARNHLNDRGTFAIVHSKTREGLKLYHKKIGYNLGRDAIPSDVILHKLADKHKFNDCFINDKDFFYFSCKKFGGDL